MMAMPYSSRLGGVCWIPSALRMRNITTAILRNPVIVTTNSGMSPAAVKKTTMPRMFILASGIVEQPCDPDAHAVADLDQVAATDATSVREDVDAVFERPQHRNECSDRKSTRLNSSHVKISYAVFCL